MNREIVAALKRERRTHAKLVKQVDSILTRLGKASAGGRGGKRRRKAKRGKRAGAAALVELKGVGIGKPEPGIRRASKDKGTAKAKAKRASTRKAASKTKIDPELEAKRRRVAELKGGTASAAE